jgi:hypoxanthine phosphoribosyltransferase
MDPLGGRYKPVGEAHAPRQAGRDTVVAIPGDQTAQPSHTVADRDRGGCKVEHRQATELSMRAFSMRCRGLTSLPHQHRYSYQKSAEPGEPRAVKKDLQRLMHEQRGIFEHMPQFGADHATDRGIRRHPDGIRVDSVALKILIQRPAGTYRRQPQAETKSANGKVSDVNEGVHAGVCSYSIAGCFLLTGIRGRMAEPMREHEHDMLFRREEIAVRVAEIGAQISHDFAGEAILLVGVLKGAAVFLADLARSISVETTFDFVAISSYKGVKTSGAVRLIKDLDTPIGGRNVILVEDILDTGLTLVFLRKLLQQHKPKTLKIATCLDKPARRLEKIDADYVAFTIPNHFVVGYGMDYQERFRNLPDIRIFNPDETPNSH